MSLPPISLAFPVTFAVTAAFSVLAVAAGLRRRASLPVMSAALAALGLISLCLAAGGVAWDRPKPGKIAVLVDISPSTRTATYHDTPTLLARIRQLVGDAAPYTLYELTDQTTPTDAEHLRHGKWSAHTRFAPPADADVILLFSDAQFDDLPATAPPTHVVLDPALEQPADAAIERLEIRRGSAGGAGSSLAISVRNSDRPRELAMTSGTSAGATTTRPVDAGRFVITRPLQADARDASVRLSRGDRWPENDWLSICAPPPRQLERWWVGAAPPPSGQSFRYIAADRFPVELSDFLSAGVIVFDNVPVDATTRLHRERLQQYVRDLGGGLVILGGDRAFAAGNYTGSQLDALSPLACDPPTPTTHWIILADSSGSMSASIGDNSRWAFAVNAINRLLPLLPPADPLSVASFARDLRWWWRDRPVKEVIAQMRVPGDIRPNGPTNLQAALRDVVASLPTTGAAPTQLLIVTDAETRLDAAATVARELGARNVRVSVLTTGSLGSKHPLQQLVAATGGRAIMQDDPRGWALGLRDLMRSGTPKRLMDTPLSVVFPDGERSAAPLSVPPPWNRTWLKSGATEIAHDADDASIPAAAAWNVGVGAVIAAGFHPDAKTAAALADRVIIPPRDPRFSVTWDPGRQLRVTLDAIDPDNRFINNLRPRLEFAARQDGSVPSPQSFAQTAPGHYEMIMAAPTDPTIAKVTLDGRTIDQAAIAGRYPPEFESIGNNHQTAAKLARLTGGSVIEPSDRRPVHFTWPTREISLAPCAAAAGALLFTAALVRSRLR